MTERVDRARQAAARLVGGWGPAEVEAALGRLPAFQRRRRRRRAGGLALAASAAAALAIAPILLGRPGGPPDRSARSPRPAAELLRLADGSSVAALAAGTRVVPLEVGPERVVIELVHGAARFSVTPSPERLFRVQAGAASVVAIGTEFDVERAAAGVEVAVRRGRVRVDLEGSAVELAAGDQRRFGAAAAPAPAPASATPEGIGAPADRAPAPATPDEIDAPGPAPTGRSALRRSADRPAREAPRWRALAARGEFDEAYRRLDPAELRGDVEDLLLAADIARLSGHPAEAVAPLRRIIDQHGADPRRPIAAFTLGRVLLDELGDPRGAAGAFAAARAAAPAGPLAEDALAREVESWSRAGEEDRAAAAADEYVRRYPAGRRLKAVRRFGGLD